MPAVLSSAKHVGLLLQPESEYGILVSLNCLQDAALTPSQARCRSLKLRPITRLVAHLGHLAVDENTRPLLSQREAILDFLYA